MELKIYSRNIELNPESEQYIQKKFNRLERHLRSISDARVEVSRTSDRSKTDRVVVQMTLTAKGRTLRGQERGNNVFTAIDAVTDVMDRQIRRYKGKVYRSEQGRKAGKASARALEAAPIEEEFETPDSEGLSAPAVVRSKRFRMRPMNVEDAITEMELLSHQFFLFYNTDSSEFNVVYERHDGDYGVIEPELT